ncbi:MAG: hypothetical protein OJF62_003146 [Pseudolabrys sp.]|nr:hypothetical protein [Pseudolabrys sp.]
MSDNFISTTVNEADLADHATPSDLPKLHLTRGNHQAVFNGSWYRGKHTNFIPSKIEITETDAAEKFVLTGWLPAIPFITRQMSITAFGSCFAAHITDHLGERGFNVNGRNLNLNAHIVRFGEGMVNTFSIRQQFEWALGEKEIPENLWFGPHKEIAAVDPVIRKQTFEIINTTDVFIVTLGLSEIWYDKISKEAFWRAIPASLFDEERHGFRLSTVDENLANLLAIHRCIRSARPQASIIITLSPIPLMATFRPISCLTANSVSKAVLRVAIDSMMCQLKDDPNLFYFPSYEMVGELFADPRAADNRHLRPDVTRFVMDTFERHYCAM